MNRGRISKKKKGKVISGQKESHLRRHVLHKEREIITFRCFTRAFLPFCVGGRCSCCCMIYLTQSGRPGLPGCACFPKLGGCECSQVIHWQHEKPEKLFMRNVDQPATTQASVSCLYCLFLT